MQRVGILNGENITYDKDLGQYFLSIANPGVISGLLVEANIVRSGKAIIKATRTNGEEIAITFENTEDLVIDTSGDKKVFIELNQANVDDGKLNNEDGTGIGEIKTATSFPTSNFIPLASITAGVITDERNLDILKTTGLTQDIETSKQVKALEFIGNGSKLTGLSAEVQSTSLNEILAEDGIVGKAYSKVNYEQLVGGTDNNFGKDDQTEISQSFYGKNTITEVIFKIKKVGSDRNDVYVELQGDNSGKPDGNVLATSNIIAKEDISDTYSEIIFTISYTPIEGTLYHFVLKATGTDVNDYFQAESAGADKILGQLSTNDGSVWTNQTDDLYFKLTGCYLATIGGTNFIGILDVNKNIGEIGRFNTQYSDNLSGLIPKAYYGYDKETGEIIPGNKFYAISSSELFLNNSFNNKNITFLIAGEDINKGDLLHFNTFDGKIYKTNSDNINFIGFSAFDSFKGSYVGVILYGEIEVNEKLIPGKKYFFQTNGTYSTNVTLNFIGYATGENLLLKETNISNLLGGALDIWSTGASSSIHRDRCGIGAYNNFLYTAGGYDGNDNLKTGEKYDILNNTWSTIADMPSVKSDLSNYAPIVNGKMYIIGGYSGSDETTNYEYDIDSNTWVSKAEMPTARNDLSIAEIGTDIYALGGEAGGDYLSVVEKYDTLTDEWSTVDSMSEARYKFTIIPYDNKIYYFGGYNGDHLTSSYEFDGTNHIALPNLPISRYGGTGGVIGGDLYIISGYEDGSNLTDRVTKYDILNKTYEDKTAIPTARRYLGGCSFNNKIYCFGGVEAGKTLEIYS